MIEIKTGWFVRCQHDLYSGELVLGPFATKAETVPVMVKNHTMVNGRAWDSIDSMEDKYISVDGRNYILCEVFLEARR